MIADEFTGGDFEAVCNNLFDQATKFYNEKGGRIAAAAMPVFQQVYDDPKNSFDKILVPITDGRKAMQVTSVLHDVIESQGQSLISDIEKGISIAIIDDEWKNHLRSMDDLRTSVQGAVYEQKDPLLIYKFESFELFKGLVSKINEEIVSFLFRGNLPENNPSQVRRAPANAPKQRLQEGRTEGGAPQQRQGPGQPAPAGPPRKASPVVKSGKSYGRNDAVSIRNSATGEVKNVKYKKAEPLLAKGWVIED
jgi:preprotein translocase subunit SecA